MLADGSDPAAAAPETLQGVVAARIDALPAEEKELLQLAAVLGKVFWTDALSSLSGASSWQLEERLHALERKEFVRREHRSAVAGSKQYVFVHALVRDGAYGQMSRAARADVHRRVADWIETLPADRADDRTEILAHHLLEAIEYSRARGPRRRRRSYRARRRRSGSRATARGDRRAERGARLLHAPTRARPGGRGRSLLPALARARARMGTGFERGGRGRARARGRGARRSRIRRPPPRPPSRAASIVWQRGDQDGAFAYFDRARALAEGAPLSPEKQFTSSRRWRASSRSPGATTEARRARRAGDRHGGGARRRRAARRRAQPRAGSYAPVSAIRGGRRTPRGASSSRSGRTRFARAARTSTSARTSWTRRATSLAAEAVTREGLASRGRWASVDGAAMVPRQPRRDDLPRRRVGRGAELRGAGDRGRAALHAAGRRSRRSGRHPHRSRRRSRRGRRTRRSSCARRARSATRRRSHPALVTAAEVAYRSRRPRAARSAPRRARRSGACGGDVGRPGGRARARPGAGTHPLPGGA